MGVISSPMNCQEQLRLETERIKCLRVTGTAVGQLVIKNTICINAIKIDRIKAFLLKATPHIFKDKIVVDGIIRKEVYYVNSSNRLRFLSEDIPFTMTLDIPGVKRNPFVHIQHHLRDIDVDFRLIPARQCLPGCLKQIIVAHIIIVASEWTQLDVVTKADIDHQQPVHNPNRRTMVYCGGEKRLKRKWSI